MKPRLPVLRREARQSMPDPPMAGEGPDGLLSRAEICRRLSISRWTLIRWVAAGTFPPPTYRLGRWQRWEHEIIREWLLRSAWLSGSPRREGSENSRSMASETRRR